MLPTDLLFSASPASGPQSMWIHAFICHTVGCAFLPAYSKKLVPTMIDGLAFAFAVILQPSIVKSTGASILQQQYSMLSEAVAAALQPSAVLLLIH